MVERRRNRGSGHHRVRLLQISSRMKLSTPTELAISLIIKNCEVPMREEKAKELVEIIETCKNEEEVIQKLNLKID